MAHDFAKKRTPSATRTRSAPAKPTHWLWFFSGLFVGVLGCVVVFLGTGGSTENATQTSADKASEAKPAASATAAATQQPSKDTRTEKPQFTFYTLLPESEVLVGNDAPEEPAAASSAATTPGDTPEAPPAPKLSLQAGSFQQLADADRRRADVILLGYDARIESVVNQGQRWHRVQIGPFKDAAGLDQAQRALRDVGIETIKVGRTSG